MAEPGTRQERTVGLIGLGIMGSAMALRLLQRGRRLAVWNLEPERVPPIVAAGAVACASPEAVTAVSDIVLLCVLDTKAVESCVFGWPFRPMTIDPAWLTSTAVAIARGIDAERAFDRMPILADALQDAGCEGADILTHLRHDPLHVRGCWVLDPVLGKEGGRVGGAVRRRSVRR